LVLRKKHDNLADSWKIQENSPLKNKSKNFIQGFSRSHKKETKKVVGIEKLLKLKKKLLHIYSSTGDNFGLRLNYLFEIDSDEVLA